MRQNNRLSSILLPLATASIGIIVGMAVLDLLIVHNGPIDAVFFACAFLGLSLIAGWGICSWAEFKRREREEANL